MSLRHGVGQAASVLPTAGPLDAVAEFRWQIVVPQTIRVDGRVHLPLRPLRLAGRPTRVPEDHPAVACWQRAWPRARSGSSCGTGRSRSRRRTRSSAVALSSSWPAPVPFRTAPDLRPTDTSGRRRESPWRGRRAAAWGDRRPRHGLPRRAARRPRRRSGTPPVPEQAAGKPGSTRMRCSAASGARRDGDASSRHPRDCR